MRSVPEWIASNDDAAIPERVQDRVARKADDCCQKCTRKIAGKLRAEIDHAIPLIIGGQHRESNLQLLCNECHSAKSKLDVRLKAKVARVHKKHLGIIGPKRKIQSAGFQKRPAQHTATRPIERRNHGERT